MAATPDRIPWVEKYRPHCLADIVGNDESVERLRVIAEDGNMPHLILTGPPGTGKTSSINALAAELLGETSKEAVLELNASDERGIDVVRNKIKMFAQKKVTLPPGKHKIVILDEADSMTSAAQQALRRTMEIYSSTTRFALACNNSSQIIEPIQSRCAILRYVRLSNAQMLKRLMTVCSSEGVDCSDDGGLEAIIFTAEGDMRQALNNLQSTFRGYGAVTAENVFKVCDQPHPEAVTNMLRQCLTGDIDSAVRTLCEVWNMGFSSHDIVNTFFKVARSHEMPEKDKLEVLREIGMTNVRITEGATTLNQMTGMLARICAALKSVK